MRDAQATVEARHCVQFYEDARVLAEQVVGFLHDALRIGGAAIAVARPVTLAMIELQLANVGHDVAALRSAGTLALVDAAQMLDQLVVDGLPDRDRFRTHVGGLVSKLAAGVAPRRVHAYGEMVDILWSAGNRQGVVALETLWSELLGQEPLSLVCGYHMRSFDRDAGGFDLVCDHHDAVAPVQALDGAITSARILAQLEQRARALETEVARRTHLERRMLALLDLSERLAKADNREQVAQQIVERAVDAVGAYDCSVWQLAPDAANVELIAALRNVGADSVERYRVVSMASDTPVAHVIRTGEPVFIRSPDDYAEQFPASRARLVKLLTPMQRAFAMLPIAINGRTLGGIVFTFATDREFADADRAFKSILARQCALAFARVEQQEHERTLREAAERAAAAEKVARSETEFLYELIASVNHLDDPDAVYDLALHTVVRGAGADRAAILLFDPDGVMRFKAARGLSDAYQRAVEGHSPWKRDALAPAPIAVDDTETDPAWVAYRDVFRAEGIRALAFVPLVHRRELIGKFMLYRDEPRPFARRELQFTATVAVHVAHAIERKHNEQELARAYREERQAHMEAEEATRAREEILSVVSHDLRSPLGTVLMGATALLNIDVGDRGHRVRSVAERIHRQAERMARLIEDLVDFAGIEAGQLAVERKAHKPDEILSATSEMFSGMADERGLQFEAHIVPGLPQIQCDCERVVQVMSNLVANALKVTPKGGAVSIGVEPQNNEIVFYVRDTGPGIAPEELPRLFQRYWRGKQPQYKGTGLGLSIARGIVDAHGGRIWAESQLGAGTTFYFSLAAHGTN